MDCNMPGFPDLHYLLELLKLMSIESVMPPNYLILANPFSSCPPSFPASGSFPRSQFFASSSQSIGASVSASVLPVNIQESLVHIWNFRWPYRNLPQETAASCLCPSWGRKFLLTIQRISHSLWHCPQCLHTASWNVGVVSGIHSWAIKCESYVKEGRIKCFGFVFFISGKRTNLYTILINFITIKVQLFISGLGNISQIF